MRKLIVAAAVLAAAMFVMPGVSTAAAGGSDHAASAGDPDRDRVDTRNERRQGTDPRKRDSDGDGVSDGREDADRDGLSNAVEDATGHDPTDRDSDDDGVADGREGAGVVTAFGDGRLTVKLAGGGSASGAVDGFTAVSCPTESGYERSQPRALRKVGKRKRSGSRRGNVVRAAGPSRNDGLVARAAQEEDDDDWVDEEGDDDWLDEEPGDDEDSSGGDDSSGEDDSADDSAEDDWTDPAPSACFARIARGTHVHESDAEGGYFVELAVVR